MAVREAREDAHSDSAVWVKTSQRVAHRASLQNLFQAEVPAGQSP